MAEPFVFHFRRGENGHPEVMYMTDLECECGLCGHVQYQRFYNATPLHRFTLERFEQLADAAHERAGYDCENCGSEVGPEHVQRLALTYGFADDAGLVRIFDDRRAHEGSEQGGGEQSDEGAGIAGAARRLYQLAPQRRLDPQELLRWEPDPLQGPVFETLSEEDVDLTLERPFNVKLAWIEILEDWLDDPEGGAYARVAPGFWLTVDASEDAAAGLIDAIDDPNFWEAHEEQDLLTIALIDAVPEGLATHADPEAMPGRLRSWLPAPLLDALDGERLWADAYMSRKIVVETIQRAFDTARLTYQIDRTKVDIFFSHITTPGEAVFGRGISVASVLRRAVYTGLTPGEAARLTAEEIVGILLRVWK